MKSHNTNPFIDKKKKKSVSVDTSAFINFERAVSNSRLGAGHSHA